MLFQAFAAILAATATVRAIPAPDPDCHDCDIVHDNQQHAQQDQGFEVVFVHVTPEGGCNAKPTQCVFDQGAPQVKAPSVSPPQVNHGNGNGNGNGNSGSRQTNTMPHNGPMSTLKPGCHWDHDASDHAHLVPVPADQGSHMYYGVTGKFISQSPANHNHIL